MAQLKEGLQAPVFKGKDQEGNWISLEDFKGKKVILYFYPKDNTPGCTAEACNLRDNYEDLLSRGFAIIGVSPDNESSHQRFREKYRLPFSLIADPEKKIIESYGVWGEKKRFGKKYFGVLRTTYIIDQEGNIQRAITKVDTKNHTIQILEALELT